MNSKIKYFIISAVLATAILFSGGIADAVDNSALIAQLQAQIQLLLQQIAQLQAQQPPVSAWCHTFNTNLGVGNSGSEVDSLKTALYKNGVYSGIDIGLPNFTQGVFSAVVGFQAKYGIAQIGIVGPVTRAKLNSLYGCANNNCPVYSPPAPGWCPAGTIVSGGLNSAGCPNPLQCSSSSQISITGVSGPASLAVGQTGTWTVNATVPTNSQISYSVNWGDYGAGYAGISSAGIPFVQTSTFTHSYSSAGTYIVNFTVKSTRSVQCFAYPCPDPVEDIARTSITVSVGNAVCAAEGTYSSGSVAPPYQINCCAGLSYLNPRPGSTGGGSICYNPTKGTPICRFYGEIGIGWYYANGTLLKAENCTPSSPSITVTLPNGGEVWTAKSIQTIWWSGINKTVDLYLNPEPPVCTYSNQACLTVIRAPYVLDRNIFSQNSVYTWIVATDIDNIDIPAGQYRMKICTAGSQTDCDVSDSYFTITPPVVY